MRSLLIKFFMIMIATFVVFGCSSDSSVSSSGNVPENEDEDSEYTSTERSILFVSADPESLALRGSGGAGRSETSKITFKVVDDKGVAVSGVSVTFSLIVTSGGLSLDETVGTSDSDGEVSVNVISGNVPSVVKVIATITSTSISTSSGNLVVSTGLPDQDSFTLSFESINPEALGIDGVKVKVTARAADHYNNPVPDGTAIYFTTDGGAIDPSCNTLSGACTVNWTSQDPRPADNDTDTDGDLFDSDRKGIVTVMAVAVGEESFKDINNDGLYTAIDKAVWDTLGGYDLPEAHLDIDGDDIYDSDGTDEGVYEEFRDFDSDSIYDNTNGIYNGAYCTDDAETAGDCMQDLVEVRDSGRIVMSGSVAVVTRTATGIIVEDKNGNSMPCKTSISVDSDITASDPAGTIDPVSFEVDCGSVDPKECDFNVIGGNDIKVTVTSGSENIVTTKRCNNWACN